MASLVQELVSGGINTRLDPTLLPQGKLQQADDCVYRMFDPSLHRAPGRIAVGTVAMADLKVKGVVHLPFNDFDDLLVAYAGTNLYSAPWTDGTGDFTVMPGTQANSLENQGDETLHVIPFGKYFFTGTGAGRPRRIGYVSPALSIVGTPAVNTLTGTVLTTDAINGFANAEVGQTLSGSGGTGTITAGSKVVSVDSSTQVTLSVTGTNGTITTVTFLGAPVINVRLSGLDPVSIFDSSQVTVVSGSWNADLGNGFYWFLVTEMLIPGQVDDYANGFVESGFTTKPIVKRITDFASDAIQITYTAPVNTATNERNVATHWQIYMSDTQVDGTKQPSLATFRRVSDPIPIATTTQVLRDDVVSFGLFNPTTSTTPAGHSAFDTPAGMFTANDGSRGSSTAGDAAIQFQDFGAGAVTGTIRGVEVTIVARADSTGSAGTKAAAHIQLRKEDLTKVSPTVAYFDVGTSWTTIKLGGLTDTWGVAWVAADFADASFEVLLLKAASASTQRLQVDGITIQVHTTGTTVNRNGIAFKVVTYRSQVGTTVSDTANLPCPNFSTGDIFQGQMIVDDPSDLDTISASLPGFGEYFPKPYRMSFNSYKKDKVKFIRTLGQIMIIGLESSIKRLNYFPTELDTDSFQQGRAFEDLATDHGIVGPMAATTIDLPGVGIVLCYVSYKGIHLTDGVTTKFLNTDLNWTALVDQTNLGTCILRNYPQENWLVFFYSPAGTTHGKNTRALIFSYSPDKVSNGELPATGPIKVSARSASEGTLNGIPKLLTGHESLGIVYIEDSGLTVPTGYTVRNAADDGDDTPAIAPVIKTRAVYPAGLDRNTREERVFLRVDDDGAVVVITTGATKGTTIDSTTVTSDALFGAAGLIVLPGMYVTGAGILPGTVVTAKASASSLTISQAAESTELNPALTFSSGTVAVTIRGQSIRDLMADLETVYWDTYQTNLLELHPNNLVNAMEIKISKIVLPDDSLVDLSKDFRLHYFAYLASDFGMLRNRAST